MIMIYSCFERENGRVLKFSMNDFCYFEIRSYITRRNPLSIAPKSIRISKCQEVRWGGGGGVAIRLLKEI